MTLHSTHSRLEISQKSISAALDLVNNFGTTVLLFMKQKLKRVCEKLDLPSLQFEDDGRVH